MPMPDHSQPCLVCEETDFEFIYDNTLKRCRSCTHVSANMQADKEMLKKVYSTNYFLGEEYLDYVKEKNVLQVNFRKRLNRASALVSFNEKQSVMELGCAYGFFAEVLLQKFPFLVYAGLDIAEEACLHARTTLGVNCMTGDYLDYTDMAKYHHAFMWDVIEHLGSPALYVEKLAAAMEPSAKIYITTGDISALLPRLQKKKWRMIHPPSHLQYFTRKSMTRLLETRGFRVLKIIYPSTARSVRQVFFSLFMLNRKETRLKKFFYNLIPEKIYFPLNTFDIMFVIAEKK